MAAKKTDASVVDKAKDDKKLTIGIKFDQPGLGLKKPDGTVEGFDVDVAKYIAKKLGVDEEQASRGRRPISANRESFLAERQVDLVVATYSITDDAQEEGDLRRAVLRRPPGHHGPRRRHHDQDARRPQGQEALPGRRAPTPAKNITEGTNGRSSQTIAVKLVAGQRYAECITKLKGGIARRGLHRRPILAGFATQ